MDGPLGVIYRKEHQKEGVMTTRRFACLLGSVACLTIVLYLALVVVATGCASMPLSSSGTHHHSEQSGHSPICAWSCQIVSQSGLVTALPTAVFLLVAFPVMAPILSSVLVSPFALRQSRAPPACAFGSFR